MPVLSSTPDPARLVRVMPGLGQCQALGTCLIQVRRVIVLVVVPALVHLVQQVCTDVCDSQPVAHATLRRMQQSQGNLAWLWGEGQLHSHHARRVAERSPTNLICPC